MTKISKIVLTFLAVDAILIGAYFLITSLVPGGGKAPMEDFPWETMEVHTVPGNEIEAILKSDAEARDLFPLYFRNYGRDRGVLKKFKGSHFVKPSKAVIEFSFPGLDDWRLVDIRFKNEKDLEIKRTILYVSVRGAWSVGDSGTLIR